MERWVKARPQLDRQLLGERYSARTRLGVRDEELEDLPGRALAPLLIGHGIAGKHALQARRRLTPARQRVVVAVEHRQSRRRDQLGHLRVQPGEHARPRLRIDAEVDQLGYPASELLVGGE